MKQKLTASIAGVVITLLFVTIGLYSCQKNDTNKKGSTTLQIKNVHDECESMFTYSELQAIGDLHNAVVLDAFNNVDFENCTTCDEDAMTYLRSTSTTDYSLIGLTTTEFFDMTESLHSKLENCSYDVRNWTNHPFSEDVYDYLVDIYDALDDAQTAEDLDDFNNAMDALQTSASSNLICEDLDIITATIKIAKSSAYLWAPSDMGGYDLLTQTFGPPPGGPTARWSWSGAVGGDIGGSAGYFTELGIVGAVFGAVPGTNAVIFTGWAVSAGVSSVLGGIWPS